MIELNWNESEKELIAKGYIMIREYNPWGYTPCFVKYPEKDIKFILGTKILSPQQMYQNLLENWVPSKEEEIRFKEFGLKRYFMLI